MKSLATGMGHGHSNFMRWLPAGLFFLVSATTVLAETWRFLYKADGIEVFSNEASPPTFKAVGILAVDVVDIFAVFADVPRRTEWVRNLSESKVVRDNHMDRVVVYSRYHLPWPASDRDSLIETNYTNDYGNGVATIQFHTIGVPGEPPRKNVIRLPKADGALYLKVLGEGKTLVRYEVNLDPGGWLPQWICNFFVRDAPINMLQDMKRRIVEQKTQYQDFKAIQARLWHASQSTKPSPNAAH